jgi:hypothetical protein
LVHQLPAAASTESELLEVKLKVKLENKRFYEQTALVFVWKGTAESRRMKNTSFMES